MLSDRFGRLLATLHHSPLFQRPSKIAKAGETITKRIVFGVPGPSIKHQPKPIKKAALVWVRVVFIGSSSVKGGVVVQQLYIARLKRHVQDHVTSTCYSIKEIKSRNLVGGESCA
jgi:hypothetical protein